MAALAIHFFGLDGSTPPPPPTTTTNPPTTTPNPPPAGGCKVADVVNSWNTGFTFEPHAHQHGSTPVNGWSLGFSLTSGETITSGWKRDVLTDQRPGDGDERVLQRGHRAGCVGHPRVPGIDHRHGDGPHTSFTLNGQELRHGVTRFTDSL